MAYKINQPIPPEFVEWDGTVYRFTGQFAEFAIHQTGAMRNREIVWLPEFATDDGRKTYRADLPQSRLTRIAPDGLPPEENGGNEQMVNPAGSGNEPEPPAGE